jgi:hypothetical protein
MRRLLYALALIVAVCLVPARANAQMQRAFGWCQNGGVKPTVAGLGTNVFVQGSFPNCTVTVYLNGTLTLATIYSDTSSTPLANPFTASSTGLWFFYAANGRYDVRFSNGGIPTPFTLADISLGGSGSGGSPGGATTDCQSNQGGVFYGDAGCTYNSTTQSLGGQGGLLISPSIPASFSNPTVTPQGTSGTTVWGYTIAARRGVLTIAVTQEVQTASGNATLTSGNNNLVAWTALGGANCYDVYRTTSNGTPASTGLISSCQSGTSFTDTGIAGDGNLPFATEFGLEGGWLGISTGLHVGSPWSMFSNASQYAVDGDQGTIANLFKVDTTARASYGVVLATEMNPGNGDTRQTGMVVTAVNLTTGASGSADAVAFQGVAGTVPSAGKTVDVVNGVQGTTFVGGAGTVSQDVALQGTLIIPPSSGTPVPFSGLVTNAWGVNSGLSLSQGPVITNLVGLNVQPLQNYSSGLPITSPVGYSIGSSIGLLIPDMSVVGVNTFGVHLLKQSQTGANNNYFCEDGSTSGTSCINPPASGGGIATLPPGNGTLCYSTSCGGGFAPSTQNVTPVNYAPDSGTTNAYVITLSPAATAYVNGLTVTMEAGTTNTGSATLNANSLGSIAIVKQTTAGMTPLVGGEIISGQLYHLVWFAISGGRFILIDPTPTNPPTLTVAHGTQVMPTTAIASGTCETEVTTTASGVLTSDALKVDTGGVDLTTVVGFQPSTAGTLTLFYRVTSGNVNFKRCNNTASSITPGALTLTYHVTR